MSEPETMRELNVSDRLKAIDQNGHHFKNSPRIKLNFIGENNQLLKFTNTKISHMDKLLNKVSCL